MGLLNNVSDWLNSIYASFGKFVHEHWFVYWIVLAIISAGGFIGYYFGWAFSLFIPAWFLFIGYMFKVQYGKTLK